MDPSIPLFLSTSLCLSHYFFIYPSICLFLCLSLFPLSLSPCFSLTLPSFIYISIHPSPFLFHNPSLSLSICPFGPPTLFPMIFLSSVLFFSIHFLHLPHYKICLSIPLLVSLFLSLRLSILTVLPPLFFLFHFFCHSFYGPFLFVLISLYGYFSSLSLISLLLSPTLCPSFFLIVSFHLFLYFYFTLTSQTLTHSLSLSPSLSSTHSVSLTDFLFSCPPVFVLFFSLNYCFVCVCVFLCLKLLSPCSFISVINI